MYGGRPFRIERPSEGRSTRSSPFRNSQIPDATVDGPTNEWASQRRRAIILCSGGEG